MQTYPVQNFQFQSSTTEFSVRSSIKAITLRKQNIVPKDQHGLSRNSISRQSTIQPKFLIPNFIQSHYPIEEKQTEGKK